jgi:hypothetical protein
MLRFKHALSVTALAGSLVVAGCNVLDAAYEEGGSVENLIEDAAHARTNQDFERAEALLRQAYEQAPENPVVRLDLASTLMQGEALSLIDLESVTSYLLDAIESEGGQARGAQADTCSWNSDEPTRPFNPRAAEGYDTFADAAPVLAEVVRLLNSPASSSSPSVLLAGLGELDPCTVAQGGALSHDRDALIAALGEHFDGDRRRVNAALTMNAVALTLGAYLGIFESPEVPVDWFLVGQPGDARVGFCTDSANLVSFEENVYSNLDAVAEAFFSLDLLIHNGGNADLQVYLDEALALYATLESSFEGFCGR